MNLRGMFSVIKDQNRKPSGFALVVTLSLMILLTLIAVGLLSLSSVSLRSSSQGNAQSEAQANARLALMIAIGELQKEMGPDMRISAESALFDSDKDTEAIDGVAQSHWLASYNSWGNWLNADYTTPGGSSLTINQTYEPRRKSMFRRWLLSMPEGKESDVNFLTQSLPGWNNSNSVVLVGRGSLGSSAVGTHLETRAYLTNIGKTGKNAWWIGPENHKARIDKATERSRSSLAANKWETSQGDTAEVGVDVLTGFDNLADNATLGDKLITTQTLRPAEVAEADMQKHFFDLTAQSRGVLASVRTGRLKKDLSLLFEKPKASLPNGNLADDPVNYRFSSGDDREPSIRPMSPEIADKPVLKGRHFASWTRMRHFYRMYRKDSDALAPPSNFATDGGGGTDGSSGLVWDGAKPVVDCNISNYKQRNSGTVEPEWDNEDTYMRFPILTNATYIVGLKTQKSGTGTTATYKLYHVTTPVFVFWNPYNVSLKVSNSNLALDVDLKTNQPMLGRVIRSSGALENRKLVETGQEAAALRDGSGSYATFNPGQFRVFTAEPGMVDTTIGYLVPGFDETKVGGMVPGTDLGSSTGTDNPRYEITFSPVSRGGQLFNSQWGNTPGSFVTKMRWAKDNFSSSNTNDPYLPFHCHVDWLDTSDQQAFAPLTRAGSEPGWFYNGNPNTPIGENPLPVAYFQLALKSNFSSKEKEWYDTIGWEQDWRCRNWIQAPPFYLGKGLYLNDQNATIANTQRIDSPYEFRFGSLLGMNAGDIIPHDPYTNSAFLSPEENINAVSALELPTAPIASIAGFACMRIEPGWTDMKSINTEWQYKRLDNNKPDTIGCTNTFGPTKVLAYQSGITGPGIGNSFLHPMISRTDVYRRLDNSMAMEPKSFDFVPNTGIPVGTSYTGGYNKTDNKAYCDYWDHVLLLNDALWDDYFVSSLADQTRGGQSVGDSLAENLKKLANGEELANSRYMPYLNGRTANDVKDDLDAAEGYLKAAKYLTVDGMFNVNSTSVAAWHALFAGIRERKVVYRDKNGALKTIANPQGKIVLSRFNTADTDQETTDPEEGVDRDDGMKAWSGVRFLDDDQLRKLAQECVKQVKRRGPFLNFSEFINRRLSDDDLGTKGALQSAIDYDDAKPESGSINYNFKNIDEFRIQNLTGVDHDYKTPEAALGSRYAGIPGYVIQSDLLKPIANTLSVRDDTFRIRAYGDSRDKNGKIVASAWCEAIVQRLPEYCESSDQPEIPARKMNPSGEFTKIEDSKLTPGNRLFGRKFQIESFRWLSSSEI